MAATQNSLTGQDGRYLQQAIAWSRTARDRGNRPFGAVIVSSGGDVLVEAYCNTTETGDCTGHAETNAVRKATKQVSREVLNDATLYSSAEPCVMCAGALHWTQLQKLVFGASDLQRGYSLVSTPLLHPKTEVIKDVRKTECKELIDQFFKRIREA